MKILILLFLLVSISLFSYNKKTIETTIRSAAEETITKSGFSLLSQDIQNEALKEQEAQSEDGDCIDDTCLMDTGKMLAAQRLFLIKVSDLENEHYMFKIIHIDLETNETVSVRSEIYIGKLDNVDDLFEFSKKFLSATSKDIKVTNNNEKIPVMLQLLFETSNTEVQKNIPPPKASFFTTTYQYFNFIDLTLNSMYLYTNFPWQEKSNNFFFGLDARLFVWNWKYFDIDILGGGIYQGFDEEFFYKLHIFELNFKPSQNFKVNIAIGPFLGDFIDYDNVQDLYRTFGGLKLEYHKIFKGLWYFNIETAAYYGTKNSEHSYYSTTDDSMDNGWLFTSSLGIGIFY